MLPTEIKDQIGRKTLLAGESGGGPPQFSQQQGMAGMGGYGGGGRGGFGPPGGRGGYGGGRGGGPPRGGGSYPTTAQDRAAAGGNVGGGYGGTGGGYHQGYGYGGGDYGDYGGGAEGSVIMVYGIHHETINAEKLFNILCLYGNVERVKFMKSKLDTAMVQMAKGSESQQAIQCLHGAKLFGEEIAIRHSNQTHLRDSGPTFEMPDGTASFMDFTSNRHQRFNTPESARRNRIIKPTKTLHWYNAPPDITEQRLSQMFTDKGAVAPCKVIIFAGKSERSSSGLAEFNDPDEATDALVLANHTPVESPTSVNPYVVKMAYAMPPRDRAAGGGHEAEEAKY